VGQDPRLAGTGTGHDEQRAASVHDGRSLLGIQAVQEASGIRSYPISRRERLAALVRRAGGEAVDICAHGLTWLISRSA
jgi:hypothetical protein